MAFPVPNLDFGDVYTEAAHQERGDGVNSVWQIAALSLGGEEGFKQTDATFASIRGATPVRVDGDHVSAGVVWVMARVDAGTGSVRLFNLTALASAGSANITSTSLTRQEFAVTFAAGPNEHILQAQRGTTWVEVAHGQIVIERS